MKSFKPSPLNHDLDARVTRFALRLTAGLTEQSTKLPHDVSERLRFAREQALTKARAARLAQPARAASITAVPMGASLALGSVGSDVEGGGWLKWASLLPLALLLAGLLLAQRGQIHEQVLAAAEVDTALLSDHLPPAAYRDPGFAEFLRDEQE